MTRFYHFVRALAKGLFSIMTRWRVKGQENIPRQGPVLIISNHMSLADVPLIGASIDRQTIFMAKIELFRYPLLNWFIRALGAFPIHRRQLDKNAVGQAIQTLKNGSVLVIFPEGSRSHNAQLQPGFPGSALIAWRSGAPIVPLGLTGTEKIKGIGWLLRPRLTVNIGHPFFLPRTDGRPTKLKLAETTHLMMQRIAELLPPEYQGSFSVKEPHEN